MNQSIQNNDSESWALYGEVTFPLADTLLGTVGLRYYRDDVTRNDSQFLIPQPEIDNEFTDWSPRLNLAWMPRDGALYYTTLSKGFRSGLTQPSIAIAAAAFVGVGIENDVESEDAWNFEVGTKLTLLDGALTLDAVAYYVQWRDQQAQILLDPVVFAFVNAGDATARGFEWAATWRAAERLTLTATGNFNETTYSDDVFDTFGRVVFEDGAQLQFVPEYAITGAADYVHPFGNGWSFVARASIEMVGGADHHGQLADLDLRGRQQAHQRPLRRRERPLGRLPVWREPERRRQPHQPRRHGARARLRVAVPAEHDRAERAVRLLSSA